MVIHKNTTPKKKEQYGGGVKRKGGSNKTEERERERPRCCRFLRPGGGRSNKERKRETKKTSFSTERLWWYNIQPLNKTRREERLAHLRAPWLTWEEEPKEEEEEAVKQELHALSPRSPLLLLLLLSAVERKERERDGQEKETLLSVVVVVFTTGSIRFSLYRAIGPCVVRFSIRAQAQYCVDRFKPCRCFTRGTQADRPARPPPHNKQPGVSLLCLTKRPERSRTAQSASTVCPIRETPLPFSDRKSYIHIDMEEEREGL